MMAKRTGAGEFSAAKMPGEGEAMKVNKHVKKITNTTENIVFFMVFPSDLIVKKP